jgi:hypothetical protein
MISLFTENRAHSKLLSEYSIFIFLFLKTTNSKVLFNQEIYDTGITVLLLI